MTCDLLKEIFFPLLILRFSGKYIDLLTYRYYIQECDCHRKQFKLRVEYFQKKRKKVERMCRMYIILNL